MLITQLWIKHIFLLNTKCFKLLLLERIAIDYVRTSTAVCVYKMEKNKAIALKFATLQVPRSSDADLNLVTQEQLLRQNSQTHTTAAIIPPNQPSAPDTGSPGMSHLVSRHLDQTGVSGDTFQ